VWDLFEGRHLFHGNDPDGKGYSTRAHLAEVMGILGPPPLDIREWLVHDIESEKSEQGKHTITPTFHMSTG
jgi:hypothetical protein